MEKWVLASKRGWGLLFMLGGVILPWLNTTFGWNVDMTAWTGLNEGVVKLIDDVATVGGFLLATWGSWVAQQPLSLKRMK